MQNLFALLESRYTAPARCAAALGISRQAYSQARARRRLSDRATIRAASLLDLDPGAALLANATAQDPTPPINNPAPDMPAELNITRPDNTNYANQSGIKKSAHGADNRKHAHSITSQEQRESVDLIRWVFAVAGLRADSPRFAYYVSRWRVPEKIAAAKKAGTFAESIARCPPIDPAWIRFVPAALEAYRAFIAPTARPPANTRASSGNSRPARKRIRRTA